VWRAGLWAVILVWSLTTYASFWISDDRSEFWRSRAVVEIRQNNFSQAATDATKALSLNPNDFETRCLLAAAFTSQNESAEAIPQYFAAMQINPDCPKILDMFAVMMLGKEKDAATHAVKLAERACELTGYRNGEMLTTLASGYADAGQISEAIATAEAAKELAKRTGDANLLKQNQELLERCRAQKTEK